MTKLDSSKRIRTVRTRGGNVKYRALRLDTGNFAWGSEHCTRKTRLLGVVSITLGEGMDTGDGREKRTGRKEDGGTGLAGERERQEGRTPLGGRTTSNV
jgi:small subunit ribosomal protein S8e